MRDSLLIPPLILSGLKYKDSKMARKAGCEFCYLIVPSSTRSPNNPIFKLTNTGNYQAYLYSIYPKYYKQSTKSCTFIIFVPICSFRLRAIVIAILVKYPILRVFHAYLKDVSYILKPAFLINSDR